MGSGLAIRGESRQSVGLLAGTIRNVVLTERILLGAFD